jgi:O-antigen biosynthesis protein WbqP
MKRFFDVILSIVLIIFLLIPMVIVALAVRLSSNGPILYWSNRIGERNVTFKMPKFRTMKTETPDIATHLMKDPQQFLSPIGGFLRKYSLDELPQLFSIFKGKMSFVGPRPALFNQYDLITLRSEKKLDQLLPGLTGWAQVNGRDDLSIHSKVLLDVEYMEKKSFFFDLKILWLTFIRVIKSSGISH